MNEKSGLIRVYDQTLNYLLDPISDLLNDESITEIMINGFQEIYIERKGKLELTDITFKDEAALLAATS